MYIPNESITGNIYTSVFGAADGAYLSFLTDDYEVITPMYINYSGTYTLLNNKRIIAILGVINDDSIDSGFMFKPTSSNESYNLGYNNGSKEGYNNGYDDGYDNGFFSGKLVGYNQGLNATSTTGGLITSLFTNVANVPVIIFNGLFSASVLNIPIISILFGMLAIAVIIFLIRKFI